MYMLKLHLHPLALPEIFLKSVYVSELGVLFRPCVTLSKAVE